MRAVNLTIYVYFLIKNISYNEHLIEKIIRFVNILQLKEIKKIINNIVITAYQKQKFFLDIISELQFDATMLRFIKYIIDHKKERFLKQMLQQYIVSVHKKNDFLHVEITMAYKISDSELQKIKEKFEKLWSKKIFITHKINADLLQGMIINYESKILDLSYRKKIQIINKLISDNMETLGIFHNLNDKKFDESGFAKFA